MNYYVKNFCFDGLKRRDGHNCVSKVAHFSVKRSAEKPRVNICSITLNTAVLSFLLAELHSFPLHVWLLSGFILFRARKLSCDISRLSFIIVGDFK